MQTNYKRRGIPLLLLFFKIRFFCAGFLRAFCGYFHRLGLGSIDERHQFLARDGLLALQIATDLVQLEAIAPMLTEGCAGQLPEIYDGGAPCEGKGCYAQAWSVGEMLRVYEKLEEIEGK